MPLGFCAGARAGTSYDIAPMGSAAQGQPDTVEESTLSNSADLRGHRDGCYPVNTMNSPAGHLGLLEVIFLVEEAPEGGFTARALGESIFTEAEDLADLHAKVRDAVRCHFDEGGLPKIIRLHFVREEVITA